MRQSIADQLRSFTPKFSMALPQDNSQTETLMTQNPIVIGDHPTNPHRPRCYPRAGSLCGTICMELPLLHPYGNFRILWDSFILIVLIYTAIEIPLTIAFELSLTLNDIHGKLIFAADSLLILDITFNFRTMYYDKWDRIVLHTDPFDIATHYLRGWFLIDFLTSFPIEFVFEDFLDTTMELSLFVKSLRAFRFVRILKIVRILRLTKNFDKFVKLAKERELVAASRLIKIMAYMLLTAHYFACVWWYVGSLLHDNSGDIDGIATPPFSSWVHAQDIDPDNDALITKYSASWYWAIVTLFTTGYGDITAHNVTEQWVSSICIIIGSVFFAFFIGTLTSYLSGDADESKRNETDRVRQARLFCQHHKFDNELTRSVITHIRYHCRTNVQSVCPHEEVLTMLPCFLQREIRERVGLRLLAELDLFRDLPKEVIGQIALEMQSVSCNRGKYLFRRGDVAKHLYIQRTGEAKLHYFSDKAPRDLRRGDVVGERALVSGRRRYCVVASMWAEFWALNVDDIQRVLQRNFKHRRFYYEWIRIKQMVKERKMGSSGYKVQRYCALETGGDGSGAGVKRDIPRTMSGERSARVSAAGVAGWIEDKITRRSANGASNAEKKANTGNSFKLELAAKNAKAKKSVVPNPSDEAGGDGKRRRTTTHRLSILCDAKGTQPRAKRRHSVNNSVNHERSMTNGSDCISPTPMFSPAIPKYPSNRRRMVPSRGNSTGPVNGPWNSNSMPNRNGRDRDNDIDIRPSKEQQQKEESTAHGLVRDRASICGHSHFGNFLKTESMGSWMTKISPFEIRHNSERRDQRVLAHTLKTMSMFAPSSHDMYPPSYPLDDGADCSDTNSMDYDEFSAKQQPQTRRVSHREPRERDHEISRSERDREMSRDSQLIMAMGTPYAMTEQKPRNPVLIRRASRKMNKFGGHQRPERRSRPQCKSAKSHAMTPTPISGFSPMNRYGLLSPAIAPDLLSPDPPSDADSSQLAAYVDLREEHEDTAQDLLCGMESLMDVVSPISNHLPQLSGIRERGTDTDSSLSPNCAPYELKERRGSGMWPCMSPNTQMSPSTRSKDSEYQD